MNSTLPLDVPRYCWALKRQLGETRLCQPFPVSLIPTDSLREFSSRSGTGYVTEEIWKKAGKCLLVTLVRNSAGSVEINTDAADLLCRRRRSPAAGTPQDVHIWLPTPPAWVFQRAPLLLHNASGDPVGLSLASPCPGAVVMLVLTMTCRRPSRGEHAAASRCRSAHPAPRAGG